MHLRYQEQTADSFATLSGPSKRRAVYICHHFSGIGTWGGESEQQKKNAEALLHLVDLLKVIPFDDHAAYEYGKVCAYLQKQGTPIGTMDMLIAAHARLHSFVLVTNNVREFSRVPNLAIENWYDE